MPLTPPLPAELAPYAAVLEAHLHQPAAWFVPINQLATGAAQSKIGGYPYLPQGAPNPLLGEDGEHTHNLLVQLNLADLPEPRPPHFPSQGLLQVFAKGFSDIMDDDPIPVRCVYYPTVAPDDALVTDFAATPLTALEGYEHVPAEGVAVAFKSLTDNRVEPGDYYGDLGYLLADVADDDERANLQQALTDYLDLYNEAMPEDGSAWEAEVRGQYPVGDYGQPVFTSPNPTYGFAIPDHQLGGLLSQFWQGDPRPPGDEDDAQPTYNQLLLAYDNRGNCTEYGVPYLGDDAKMLLYINRDELARGNFGDLLYSWMP